MSECVDAVVRRILIVDDNTAIHEDFRKVLSPDSGPGGIDRLDAELFGENGTAGEALRFELDCASQGTEALELVHQSMRVQTPYVAAFVDVRMPPGWDGLETTKRLWEADPRIEVVLCTAYSDYSWKQIVARLGYTDRLLILKKPFDGAEVRQLALALAAKWQLKRAAEGRQAELERMIGTRTAELEERNRQLEQEVKRHEATARELGRSNEVRGEQARVLTLLLELSRNLATADDVPTIVDHTLRVTVELTGCRRVSVMLPDAEHEYLTIAGALGMDPELTRQVRVPVGSGIAGQVFRSGCAIVLNTAEETTRNQPQYDSPFFISAPLTARALVTSGKIVGVLNLTERAEHRPFAPGEVESIDMICNMAASAMNEIETRQARDEARDAVVRALATLVEYRDCATGQHLDRVTGFALLLAEALRGTAELGPVIDDAFLQDLRRAMPLHDIGKVAIPDYILGKRGKLNQEEMRIMRRHAEIGAQAICTMIERTSGAHFLTVAAEIAHCHHERFDGTGYPCGLSRQGIPLSAQIAALADVYDALTSKRPYKEAFTHEHAAEIIRQGAGTQFDPLLVQAFVARERDFAALNARLTEATRPPNDLDAVPNDLDAVPDDVSSFVPL